jgi:hypothetical protein
MRVGFWKQETYILANSASPAKEAKAKSNQQNPSVPNDGHAPTLGCVWIRLNMTHDPMGQQ